MVDDKKKQQASTLHEMSHMSQGSQMSQPSEGQETIKPYTADQADQDSIREPFKENKEDDDIL